MKLFQKNEFIKRIEFAISENNPITLIVGSPISYDYGNKKGVADVSETIQRIRQSFASDTESLEKLNISLQQPDANPYQKAFEYALAVRGSRYANNLIRQSVLNAYEDDREVDQRNNATDDSKWYLPPAVNAIGKLLASRPEAFGSRILTTNFDPLIEVAIRRNGGTSYSNFFHRDGNPNTTNARGVGVIHLHGFWEDRKSVV